MPRCKHPMPWSVRRVRVAPASRVRRESNIGPSGRVLCSHLCSTRPRSNLFPCGPSCGGSIGMMERLHCRSSPERSAMTPRRQTSYRASWAPMRGSNLASGPPRQVSWPPTDRNPRWSRPSSLHSTSPSSAAAPTPCTSVRPVDGRSNSLHWSSPPSAMCATPRTSENSPASDCRPHCSPSTRWPTSRPFPTFPPS
jgi:hypothetical protein